MTTIWLESALTAQLPPIGIEQVKFAFRRFVHTEAKWVGDTGLWLFIQGDLRSPHDPPPRRICHMAECDVEPILVKSLEIKTKKICNHSLITRYKIN